MADLNRLSSGKYSLSGDIGLVDIAALREFPVDDAESSVELDLSKVNSADSAMVALLLDWRRQLDAKGESLSIINIPESVRLLLDLYDLEPVLSV